jgi:hypothetical protein
VRAHIAERLAERGLISAWYGTSDAAPLVARANAASSASGVWTSGTPNGASSVAARAGIATSSDAGAAAPRVAGRRSVSARRPGATPEKWMPLPKVIAAAPRSSATPSPRSLCISEKSAPSRPE